MGELADLIRSFSIPWYWPLIVYLIGAWSNVLLRHRLLHERRGYTAGRRILPLTDERRFDINYDYWRNFLILTLLFIFCR